MDCSKSDRTTSIVLLNKIVKMIGSDDVSNGSKVELNYGGVTLEAEIIRVNGMYVFLTQMCISWLNTCLLTKWKKVVKVTATQFGNLPKGY